MKLVLSLALILILVAVTVQFAHRERSSDVSSQFQGWEKEVIEAASRTPNTNANAYQLHLICGHVFNDHNLREKAIQEYQTAITVDSRRPAAYASLGATYEALEDFTKAVENWETARQLGQQTVDEVNITEYINSLKARGQRGKQ